MGQNQANTAGAELAIVTLVNDGPLYDRSRESFEAGNSPAPAWIPVRADEHGWNAAQGLNHGLGEAAGARWVVLAHQDVLYPAGWWARAREQLESVRDRLGVAGLVGRTAWGGYRGHVVDPNGHRRWGPLPARAVTLDEHALIVRGDTPLRFDPGNPGFHCYGADLALEARRRGLDALVIDAPVAHLSRGRRDPIYERASAWLVEKWGDARGGAIPTCAGIIRRRGAAAWLRWRVMRSVEIRVRKPMFCRCDCRAAAPVDAEVVPARYV
jgi:hypothetical protein